MKPTPPTKGDCKDILILPRVQAKVYRLLCGGGKYSAADISVRLHLCDPRGHISALRTKGINIHDEWREDKYGVRYKVYFL